MNIIKKTIFLQVSVLSLATLCSCGSKEDSNELVVWWPSGLKYQAIIDDVKTKFEADHPGYSVKVVSKAGMEMYQTYQVALRDPKSIPDIAILDHVYVSSLAHENQLANLSELGADTELKSKYPDSIYSANSYLGKTYGLPLSANTVALMYNKDILEANGIYEAPTTFEELTADLTKIQNNSGSNQVAFAQPINDTFCAMEFASYVGRLGGKLVSDDYKTCLFNTPIVKEAVNKWVELSKFASQAEYQEGKFYDGYCGFIEMGSWNLYKVTGNSALFDLGISEMVTLDSSINNFSGLGLYSLVVSQKSTKKDLAYDFAKFVSTDKTTQINYAKVEDLFPCTNEALDDPYYVNDECLSIYASQLKKVVARPSTPVWPTIEKQIVNMLYKAVKANNQSEIDAAISTCQTQCQEATNRKFN